MTTASEIDPAYGPADEEITVGPFLVRRAQPSDALAYAQADAEMVAGTYGYTMPPEFAEHRLAEVPERAATYEASFAENLRTERSGSEPAHRTWIAWQGDRVAGVAVSGGFRQDWEDMFEVAELPGVRYQLNHLYVRPDAHGSGLGQALLDIALPGRRPAYLWIVAGNARAERFYARNGFAMDERVYSCGPIWYHQDLYRMYRLPA